MVAVTAALRRPHAFQVSAAMSGEVWAGPPNSRPTPAGGIELAGEATMNRSAAETVSVGATRRGLGAATGQLWYTSLCVLTWQFTSGQVTLLDNV